MGGVCAKDELNNSAFIKINTKEIQANKLNKLASSKRQNGDALSPSKVEFKSSSYNLFDIQGFILPEIETNLVPSLSKDPIISKASHDSRDEVRRRRRSSEISVLQLPPEEEKHVPIQGSPTFKKLSKRPSFTKAPKQFSEDYKKILRPPKFKKTFKRPNFTNNNGKPSVKKDEPKEKSINSLSPYGKNKPPERKPISYRTSEDKYSRKNINSKNKEKADEIPLLKKETFPLSPKKSNSNKIQSKPPVAKSSTLESGDPVDKFKSKRLPPKGLIDAKSSKTESTEPLDRFQSKRRPPKVTLATKSSKLESNNAFDRVQSKLQPPKAPLGAKSPKIESNEENDDWLTISLKQSSALKPNKARHSIRRSKRGNLGHNSTSDPNLSLIRTHPLRESPKGSSKPFTNISIIKSATHSLESNVSNFERRTKIESFPDKKTTLNEAGLGKELKLTNKFTQKDFKQKKEAYNDAVQQMQSGDWEKEILGINSLVSLIKSDPEIIKNNIQMVVRLLMGAVKNLRSQVCRSGAQAFAELYVHVGRAMEGDSDKIIPLLLNKAVDTNKFIRQDCNTALDLAMENISVYKGLLALLETGVDHKNVVARINTSRILSNIVQILGAEKVMGSSKEFQSLVFVKGCALLGDGSLEVRNHAKKAFKELSSHESYESNLKKMVPETQRRYIQKTLDSLQRENT